MNRNVLTHKVRERLRRLPEPHAAHYGVVPLPPPEDGIDLGAARQRVEAAVSAMARAEALAAAGPHPWLVSRLLPRREAVSSSAIEGTQSTLDELLSAEETGDEGAAPAAKQVKDYALTLDAVIPRAKTQGPAVFSLELIRHLHRQVMADDPAYQDIPGELRRCVVWIGGNDIAYSTYNPAPPDAVEACLRQTVDYLRCDGMQAMTQGLISRMALAHAHFEAVHPFRDGNGRVGRLLLPLMMAADGRAPLYLSPYIEARKGHYYDALKAAQQRLDWGGIIGFLADAMVGTVAELEVTQSALVELGRLWRGRRRFRQGSAALAALDLLPHYPVLTAKRLASLLQVSLPAASTAMGQLEGSGILVERTGYSRNRIFSAPEVLRVINRPFGAEPVLPEDCKE